MQQELTDANLKATADSLRAKVAHDLRSPLQTVLGYTEILAAETPGPLNPRQRQFVENIRVGARKMLELLDRERRDSSSSDCAS